MYLSPNMDRVTSAARATAAVSVVVGTGMVGFAVALGQWQGLSPRLAFGGAAFYVLPGVLLWVAAWRMDRADGWAYVFTAVLSGALLVRYVLAVTTALAAHAQLPQDPLVCETICRLPGVYLMIGCLNALPDVRDRYRARRRDRRAGRRGFEPLVSAAAPARLPPPPANGVRRPAATPVPAVPVVGMGGASDPLDARS